eukprot:COSAG02_NODE_2255_length_9345_cov_3.269414_7_plen_92_part_00
MPWVALPNVQVVSYDKLYAEHGAVTGDFAPSGSYRRGKIKFEWDNSFSKLTAKTVHPTPAHVLCDSGLVELANVVLRCSTQISFKLSYSTY